MSLIGASSRSKKFSGSPAISATSLG
jgi:hypothetical protein